MLSNILFPMGKDAFFIADCTSVSVVSFGVKHIELNFLIPFYFLYNTAGTLDAGMSPILVYSQL